MLIILFNINHLFVHSFKYSEWLNIWPIDETLIGTTTLAQSEPGSNGNEGVLHKAPGLEPHHQTV